MDYELNMFFLNIFRKCSSTRVFLLGGEHKKRAPQTASRCLIPQGKGVGPSRRSVSGSARGGGAPRGGYFWGSDPFPHWVDVNETEPENAGEESDAFL